MSLLEEVTGERNRLGHPAKEDKTNWNGQSVTQSFNGYRSYCYCKSSFIPGVDFTAPSSALLKTGKNLPLILTFFDFSVSFINASGFL